MHMTPKQPGQGPCHNERKNKIYLPENKPAFEEGCATKFENYNLSLCTVKENDICFKTISALEKLRTFH